MLNTTFVVFLYFMTSSELPNLREWLAEEPYTLTCSSGFFGFYAQCGVISALHENELLPKATRGSSTGALATALWASGSFDYDQVGEKLSEIERTDFWDPSFGPGLLKGERLDGTLRSLLSDRNFGDCLVPVRISVFDIRSRQTEVIESGDLTQAVHASITFPGLFQPVKIGGRLKTDGGIKDHAGCYGAPLDERILHQNLRPKSYNISDKGYLNSQTLTLENLPFVHPFRLQKGIEAYNIGRAQAQALLDQPIIKL